MRRFALVGLVYFIGRKLIEFFLIYGLITVFTLIFQSETDVFKVAIGTMLGLELANSYGRMMTRAVQQVEMEALAKDIKQKLVEEGIIEDEETRN